MPDPLCPLPDALLARSPPHTHKPALPPITAAVSVILAYFVSSDGSSNWLLGLQLVATYCLIGFVFLLEREGPEPGRPAGTHLVT